MRPSLINCQDCGASYETVRANTKYCSRCRLLRNLRFVGKEVVKCWICQRDTAPLERNDNTCGACSYKPARNGEAECAYCHEVRPRVRAATNICHECAHDPTKRADVIVSLRKGQAARRKPPVVA